MRIKESHRPVTKYPIKNIMRKNRFIMTKEEYESCCKIARGYRAYRLRKDIDLLIQQRQKTSYSFRIRENDSVNIGNNTDIKFKINSFKEQRKSTDSINVESTNQTTEQVSLLDGQLGPKYPIV